MADKIVDIPGKGEVHFPDTMSDAEIANVIQSNFSPKELSWAETAKGATKQFLPGMLIRAPSEIIGAAINPKAWAGAAGTLAGGVASIPGVKEGLVALGEKPEVVEQAKVPFQQFVEAKKEQYGTIPRLKHTLATTPEAPIMDITALTTPFKGRVASAVNPYAEALRLGGKEIESATAPALAAKKAVNETRDATIKQSLEAGYTIPRSSYNPSMTTSALESAGGKAAVGQEASHRNQAITDKLARQYLGLPEDTAFSEGLIESLLKTKAAPYKEASALPSAQIQSTQGGMIRSTQTKTGAELVNDIKLARDESRGLWNAYNEPNQQNRTEILNKANAADAKLDNLENQLEQLAKAHNKPDLVEKINKARQDLAKVHTVEKAMNPATGEINAANFKQQYNKNVPLTDEAKIIADFANSFPNESRLSTKTPSPDVSKLNAILAGGGATAGGFAGGVPGSIVGGLTAYGVPIAARSMALSKMLQKLPSYEQNMVVKMMKASPKANPLALALYELNNQGEQ